MKKLFATFLFALLSLPAVAQFTVVTGTVTDPNGLLYAYGSITPTLIASSTPTIGGLPYTPPGTVGLTSGGSFTMQLANASGLSPSGTTWNFQVCSGAGTVPPAFGNGPVCFTITGVTISGATQDLSSTLDASAVALTTAFSSNLPSGCTNGQTSVWNGTKWVCSNAGTGTISGSGTTNLLPVFTGAAALGNSSITDNGTVSTSESLEAASFGTTGSGFNGAVYGVSKPSSCSGGSSDSIGFLALGCSSIRADLQPTATSSTVMVGVLGNPTTENTSTNYAVGVLGQVSINGGASDIRGVQGQVEPSINETIPTLSGLVGVASNATGNTSTTVRGGYFRAGGTNSNNTNTYGLFVDSPFSTSGTQTYANNYGLYIADQTTGPATLSNPFALYTAGTAQSRFGGALTVNGNLSINVTGSTQCLHANSSGIVSGTGSDCGSGGGGLSGQTALGFPIAATSTTSTSSTTPGTNQGTYFVGRQNTTQGTALTPTELQAGDCSSPTTITGSASTGTVAYTDAVGCTVVHDKAATASATITIPVPTGASSLNNAHPFFTYCNESLYPDNLTPTTYQIALNGGTAGASVTLAPQSCYRVNLDPVNASTWTAQQTTNQAGLYDVRAFGALGNSNGTTGNGNDDSTAIATCASVQARKCFLPSLTLAGATTYYRWGTSQSGATIAGLATASGGALYCGGSYNDNFPSVGGGAVVIAVDEGGLAGPAFTLGSSTTQIFAGMTVDPSCRIVDISSSKNSPDFFGLINYSNGRFLAGGDDFQLAAVSAPTNPSTLGTFTSGGVTQSGTATFSSTSTAVTGSSTSFQASWVGAIVEATSGTCSGDTGTIASVASTTSMTLSANFAASCSGVTLAIGIAPASTLYGYFTYIGNNGGSSLPSTETSIAFSSCTTLCHFVPNPPQSVPSTVQAVEFFASTTSGSEKQIGTPFPCTSSSCNFSQNFNYGTAATSATAIVNIPTTGQGADVFDHTKGAPYYIVGTSGQNCGTHGDQCLSTGNSNQNYFDVDATANNIVVDADAGSPVTQIGHWHTNTGTYAADSSFQSEGGMIISGPGHGEGGSTSSGGPAHILHITGFSAQLYGAQFESGHNSGTGGYSGVSAKHGLYWFTCALNLVTCASDDSNSGHNIFGISNLAGTVSLQPSDIYFLTGDSSVNAAKHVILGSTSGSCALTVSATGGTLNICGTNATVTSAGAIASQSTVSAVGFNPCPDTSGSGSAQTCNTPTTFTPTAQQTVITYTTTTANTGASLTVNVNGLGAKSVAIAGASGWTTTLTAGIIPANEPLLLAYDGTNWDVQQTGTAASGSGSPCTTTANSIQYDNAGSFGCTGIQDISNDLSNTTTTQAQTFQGGQDASANSALGAATFRGASQTGAGGATSAGGNALFAGGSDAATNTASTGGNVELQSGRSTGTSSTGLQGLMLITHSYAQTGTVTQWNLVCHTTTANAVTNCAGTPQNIAGVAVALSGTVSVLVAEPGSEVPINASAAVTLGDAVYGGGTAGKVTDCGASSGCPNGVMVGQVIATTGTWQAYPDGTAFPTLSTTLPLIKLVNLPVISYVNNANGQTNISAATSFGVTIAVANGSAQFNATSGTSFESALANGWTSGSSFQNAVTTNLKATAAGLTAGQVVKMDTSNAESVVVATTTDTGAGAILTFVVNSPATGGFAHLALPGTALYTPVLGTGTCTLGQFVIVDTTTNGRVKCSGTFTAGTVLGRVIVAQSTVGSAVGVYVWPQ